MRIYELNRIIFSKNDEWVVCDLQRKNGEIIKCSGNCIRNFGCSFLSMVPGQVYKGDITKNRNNFIFKGHPQSRRSHLFKSALKTNDVCLEDRRSIFEEPIQNTFEMLDKSLLVELEQLLQLSSRKAFTNTVKAFDSIKEELNAVAKIKNDFPKLAEYLMNRENDFKALYNLFENMNHRLIHFLKTDPFRLIYDDEYDHFRGVISINPPSLRHIFKDSTSAQSRKKMVQLICQDQQIDQNDPRRVRYSVICEIVEHIRKTGSYWMPLESFTRNPYDLHISIPTVIRDNYITLNKYAEIESFLTAYLQEINGRTRLPRDVGTKMEETLSGARVDDHQKKAIEMAFTEPLFILTGGAGTGKTSVCKYIVDMFEGDIVLASPTGKAAQRLSETTGEDAWTIHRLMYLPEVALDFKSLADIPNTLLIDEASMLDPETLACLCRKKQFDQIIFVGDCGQLASVGPGNLLSDIINSKQIAHKNLVKIYRNDSFIASNGQKIRDRDSDLDCDSSSFEIFPYVNDMGILDKVKDEHAKNGGIYPIVLCNSNAETAKLNQLLREIINPSGTNTESSAPMNLLYSNKRFLYKDWKFNVGDNVMNVKNKYDVYGPEHKDKRAAKIGDKYMICANGETGTVIEVNNFTVNVMFPIKNWIVEFDLKKLKHRHLLPSYCITVHKSQGSEYHSVIVKCQFARFGDNQKRFYTGESRAQKKCIVFEVKNGIRECINSISEKRITNIMPYDDNSSDSSKSSSCSYSCSYSNSSQKKRVAEKELYPMFLSKKNRKKK